MSEFVMLELVDIKEEIDGTVFHPSFEEGTSNINNLKHDSVHADWEQIQLRDPLILDIPSTPQNLEIKCEVEDVETMDYASETEMMLETGETSESDCDKTTTGTGRSLLEKPEKRERYSKEDPLKAETAERKVVNNDPDYSETRNSSNQDSMKSHHEVKPFKCEHCGKQYSRKHALMAHMRIHNGEGLFNCEECDEEFTELYKLTRHKRVHTGDRPYKCDECEKGFARSDKLNEHKKVHTEERPFKCQECEQTFKRSDKLTRHKKTHTGVRLYKCNECDKTFSRSDSLLMHTKTHTGERPFQCNECEKTFSRSDHLSMHKKTHTGERPFQCNECKKNYARLYDLTRHMRNHNK